jgi:hypothetical protein
MTRAEWIPTSLSTAKAETAVETNKAAMAATNLFTVIEVSPVEFVAAVTLAD